MMIPSQKDWKVMQSVLQRFMPDVISFYSTALTYDQYGQETTTRTLVTTVSGQLSNPTGSEVQHVTTLLSSDPVNEGIENTEIMHCVLPYTTTLATTYEAVTADGKRWQITNVNDTQTFIAAKVCTLYRHLVGGTEVS